MNYFRAPWSKSLIVASTFATLVCLGAAYALWTVPAKVAFDQVRLWFALLPLAIIFICALFTVRGYSFSRNDLLIDRLFWTTRISLNRIAAGPLRSHRDKPERSHVRQRRLLFFHRIFSE